MNSYNNFLEHGPLFDRVDLAGAPTIVGGPHVVGLVEISLSTVEVVGGAGVLRRGRLVQVVGQSVLQGEHGVEVPGRWTHYTVSHWCSGFLKNKYNLLYIEDTGD